MAIALLRLHLPYASGTSANDNCIKFQHNRLTMRESIGRSRTKKYINNINTG